MSLKITHDFYFKRKHFIKDLLSVESLLKNTSILEFESFDVFANAVLRDGVIPLNDVGAIKVPAATEEEIELLLKINPDARPFLYVSVENPDVLKAYHSVPRMSLYVEQSDVEKIVEGFPDFKKIVDIPCVFHVAVDSTNILELHYLLSEPFLLSPQFCTADIDFNYMDLEPKTTVRTFEPIRWVASFVKNNIYGREEVLRFDNEDGSFSQIKFKFLPLQLSSAKRLYVSGEGAIGFKESFAPGQLFEIDAYHNKDCNYLSQKKIDEKRAIYDVKFTDACGIRNKAFINILQNYKSLYNPAMIPAICYMLADLFG